MYWTISQSIKATLLYASLFEYAMTPEEIYRWLIWFDKPVEKEKIISYISKYSNVNGYISLVKPREFAAIRNKRQTISERKWKIAQKYGGALRYIPSVMFVGISGGLSMNNTAESDDIDLFIITKKHMMWGARFFVSLFLMMVHKKRQFGQSIQKDLLCPNMFLTEDSLSIPSQFRDIYTAHEVLQMVPLWDKDSTYHRFLRSNSWTASYLPYAWKEKYSTTPTVAAEKKVIRSMSFLLIGIFYGFEPFARIIQKVYMQPHITTEIVTDTVLRFHPRDVRSWVAQRYRQLLSQHKVPLDSKFFKPLQ